MSADACLAFYGLRFLVLTEEIGDLEERTDPRQIAARKAGLTAYWANFGGETDRYVLFVGTRIATLGPENEVSAGIPSDRLSTVMSDTKALLAQVGLGGEPALHLEWLTDA